MLPYSSGLLHAYLLSDKKITNNYNFKNYIFHAPNGVEKEFNKIYQPNIVGISLVGWNVRRSLKLAKMIKEKYPDCIILVGGPEVPDDASQFLRNHRYIDLAVHKEGEETFRQFMLENLTNSPNWNNLSGVSFIQNDEFIHKKRTHGFLSPVDTPSPYLLGLFEESLAYIDHLKLPRINVWETNRGCPYSCTFCDWGSATNQKIRLLPEDRVLNEIEHIGNTYDEIHLADANFGALKRDLMFAKKLTSIMASGGRLKSIHINYVKNLNDTAVEIAENLEALKLSRAGFTFAFNSLNKDSLSKMKRYNIPKEKFILLKQKMDQLQIPTNAELIWGAPGETVATFLDGYELCMENGITDIRTYQLNMYPNSEIGTLESRNLYGLKTDWIKILNGAHEDEDEYIETVIATNSITEEEMRKTKKIVELIDVLHFGRWTYYFAQFLKKEHAMPFTQFYSQMVNYFWEKTESVICKVIRGIYIDTYNSGAWNAYRGPHSPFGVQWGHCFFRKSTFFWLCIAENKNQFYNELNEFLSTIVVIDQKYLDLIQFQKDILIDFDYDPNIQKNNFYKYNWLSYFREKESLSQCKNQLIFKDKEVGRFNKAILPNSPESYFNVAGGNDFYFEKMNAFEFKKIDVVYHHDNQ